MRKPKSLLQTHRVMSPVEASNVRELSGETLLRHMQYPTTILKFMRDRQENILDNLVRNLDRCIVPEKMVSLIRGQYVKYESEAGCLRHFYKSELRSDGQMRYEASDDLSFDICGSFCPNCELSRRLCENLPVHYSVPDENETIEPPMDGFTEERWMSFGEPDDTQVELNEDDPRIRYWTLSPTLFRDLLALLSSANLDEGVMNRMTHSYGCGGMRFYVSSDPDTDRENMQAIDIAQNILRQISRLGATRVYKNSCKVNIYASEISPFVKGDGPNEVFYDGEGNIHIDVRSRVIHGMSVRITNSTGFQNVFICPEINDEVSMTFVKSIPELVPDNFMLPRLYYNVPGIGVLLMMIVLYLSSDPVSEYSEMVYSDPMFMDRLGIMITDPDELGRIRKAMIDIKLDNKYETYREMVKMSRIILQGLSI